MGVVAAELQGFNHALRRLRGVPPECVCRERGGERAPLRVAAKRLNGGELTGAAGQDIVPDSID